MTSGTPGAETASHMDPDWSHMVPDQVHALWETTLAGSSTGVALDVGALAFLRLADHRHEIDVDSIGSWLTSTAESTLQGLSEESWRTSPPFLGSSSEAIQELTNRATTALAEDDRLAAIAVPITPTIADRHRERYVSMPWRGRESEADPLPTPDSLWQGRFIHDPLIISLVLLNGQPRRMHGLAQPTACHGARLRGSEGWSNTDSHGRFRIESVPPGPMSVEIDTDKGLVTTEWMLL